MVFYLNLFFTIEISTLILKFINTINPFLSKERKYSKISIYKQR